MKKLKLISGLFFLCSLFSCDKSDLLRTNPHDPNSENFKPNIPELTTIVVTDITGISAKTGGNIKSDGGGILTARGVCWNLAINPTILNYKTTDVLEKSNFESFLSGLSGNTKYYVRAYATNRSGTGYGNEVSFTTRDFTTDTDGNMYYCVTIGTQVWMQENLKTKKYRNGDLITYVTENPAWSLLNTGAYCWYNNDTITYKKTYGALYNWYAVSDSRGLCPTGWHVPGDSEWSTLTSYLGESFAGNKLKETGITHWTGPNSGATNESYFTALPGGTRGTSGIFNYSLGSGGWWSISENDVNSAVSLLMYFNYNNVTRGNRNKQDGFSVRCVKGSETVLALPALNTQSITNISSTTAICGGIITLVGGSSITARGVCWNISTGPTISNNKTSDGTGSGSFSSNLTGLSTGIKYYVRAYATNSLGTAYGDELSFTANAGSPLLATLTTTSITGITQTTATSGGNISNDGGALITARGICWNTASSPTIVNSKTSDATGTGSFISNLTGLLAGTTYYIRAYATNSAGTAYGNELSFTASTGSPLLATLTTTSITGITQTTATSGGNISNDGGASITARGVCWNTTSSPTIINSKTSDASGTGTFVSSISGLTAGSTYYVRAYATNSAGTSYGNELSFTTSAGSPVLATLTTTSITGITQTTATSGGNITNDGGALITARGICWNTAGSPTIANSKTSDGTGTGSFISSITGLTTNTNYYIRAYATNSVGTAYGSQTSFTTAAMGARNVTAGQLSTVLTAAELNTLTRLTLTGTIDARDFKTMRDNMPQLAEIDISMVSIAGYTGTEGTSIQGNNSYPANTIPEFAFSNSNSEGKNSLTSFVFPTSLIAIGNYAFMNCNGLISILIPSSVTTIGVAAFATNNSITSVTIPASVTSIGSQAFLGCPGLINVDLNNQYYSSISGILFNKPLTEIIQYPSTKIGSYNIPSTVITIGISAFWNCLNITSVTIPTSVTSIKWAAFGGCNSLISVTIPSSVLSLERYAFQNCLNLTSVIIPSSVISLGNSIFQGCSSLASIYSYSAVPVDLSSAPEIFIGVNLTTCKLYVPFGAKSAYQSAIQWQNFANIVEMSAPVSDVDGNSYPTVTIGTQVWMTENLKTTKFTDSQLVPLVTSSTAWNNLTTPGYCWYNNDVTLNKYVYGALYNWYAINTEKLCPAGWHVPADTEWSTLINYLGGASVAGGKLKETGTEHWDVPNVGATNETGFTARPGGGRNLTFGFRSIGRDAHWWSSTQSLTDTNLSWMVWIGTDESTMTLGNCCINDKYIGYSVRCVKN